MTDIRPDTKEPAAEAMTMSETVDTAIRRISTAVIVAGAIVGLAVYARPGPPRYDAFAVGERIVRVDTRTGSIIRCEDGRTCELILKRGQRLARPARAAALPKSAAPAIPPPAAPAAER